MRPAGRARLKALTARAGLAAGLLAPGCGVGLGAQPSPPPVAPDLDRIEAAVDEGGVEGARVELAAWLEANRGTADRQALARARFLRARLALAADSARADYLWVAISGGSSLGAEAWLRLAQMELASGRPGAARSALERLRLDYPNHPRAAADAWYWEGLARQAMGEVEAACAAWDRARNASERSGDAELGALSREAAAACGPGLRVTVQLGAFGSRVAAEGVRERARAAGFEARVERQGGLHRVRVGRFGNVESARELAERLRAAGFSAVVMADDGP